MVKRGEIQDNQQQTYRNNGLDGYHLGAKLIERPGDHPHHSGHVLGRFLLERLDQLLEHRLLALDLHGEEDNVDGQLLGLGARRVEALGGDAGHHRLDVPPCHRAVVDVGEHRREALLLGGGIRVKDELLDQRRELCPLLVLLKGRKELRQLLVGGGARLPVLVGDSLVERQLTEVLVFLIGHLG